MPMSDELLRPLLLMALIAVSAPAGLDAQVRRGRASQAAPGAWAPISVGVHAGYDDASRAELAGARAFLPLIRSGRLQAIPGADVVFLSGARDYQYSADLVYVTGGAGGGLYAGGGIGWRDSVVDGTPADPRNTFFTYNVVVGLQSGMVGPFQTQLQIRWIFLQDVVADFRPVSFTLGISFPLWRPEPAGS